MSREMTEPPRRCTEPGCARRYEHKHVREFDWYGDHSTMTEYVTVVELGAWEPCTCRPDDGSGRCEREQECYETWLLRQNLEA